LRLLLKSVTTAGKSALIAVGAVYGLLRGLRALGEVTRNTAGMETLQARVDTIHLAVARLAEQTGHLQNKLEQVVTKDELSEALERVFGQLEREVDARFESQNRSAEALRMMVGQTDELLQRVLDGLESMKAEDEAEHDQNGRQWDLTGANR
jgi:hypothetical protein